MAAVAADPVVATRQDGMIPMQLQRTILWIVFSMSLLFLWDSWQRHNGKPSLLMGMTTQSDSKAGAKGTPPAAPGAAAKSSSSRASRATANSSGVCPGR